MKKHKLPTKHQDWAETHFEISAWLALQIENNTDLAVQVYGNHGRGGFYELAWELTQDFQDLHGDYEWDGDYFEALEDYLKQKTEEILKRFLPCPPNTKS